MDGAKLKCMCAEEKCEEVFHPFCGFKINCKVEPGITLCPKHNPDNPDNLEKDEPQAINIKVKKGSDVKKQLEETMKKINLIKNGDGGRDLDKMKFEADAFFTKWDVDDMNPF